MNAEQREQLRIRLMVLMSPNGTGFGLPTALLLMHVKMEAWRDLSRDELESELQYLEEKGLVKQPVKMISPENRVWGLTAAGRDFLAVQKLA